MFQNLSRNVHYYIPMFYTSQTYAICLTKLCYLPHIRARTKTHTCVDDLTYVRCPENIGDLPVAPMFSGHSCPSGNKLFLLLPLLREQVALLVPAAPYAGLLPVRIEHLVQQLTLVAPNAPRPVLLSLFIRS